MRLEGRERRGASVSWSRKRFLMEQTVISRLSSRAGRDRQFTLERNGAGMVDPQCAGAVAAQHVQAHQLLVGRLVEWIVPQQALGIADRRRIRALLLQE